MRSDPASRRRQIGWFRRIPTAAIGLLAAAWIFAPALAHAQSSEPEGTDTGSLSRFLDRYFWGKNVASVGFFYIKPLDSSEPLTTSTASLGLGTFTSPGTSSSVSDAVTPSFTLRHFFTENFATTFAFGVPPKYVVNSRGIVAAPVPGLGQLNLVDLGAPENNPSITAREWSPAFLVHYFFGGESSRFRPFLGVGVAYNFFTDAKLNGNLERSLADLGPLLEVGLGRPITGPADVSIDLTSSWQVVGNAGLQVEFIRNWVATASVSFVPLKTTAVITLRDSDGSKLSVSKADIKINPLVFEFAVGYKF